MQLAELLDERIGGEQTDRFNRNMESPSRYIWRRIKEDPSHRNWIIDKIEERAERTENGRKVPSELHRMIMETAARWGGVNVLVLTTNYDLLLEAAAEQGTDWLGSPRRWVGRGDGGAAAARGIYHLHGTVEDRETIRLTDEEMENHYGTQEGEEAEYLGEIFRDRVVLAVGYSFGDPEIGKVLESINKDSPGETYAIVEGIPGGGRPPDLTDRVKTITYTKGKHQEVKEVLRRIEDMAVESNAATQARTWDETGRMGPGCATPTMWKQIRKLIETGDANLIHFLNGTIRASDADEWICVEMLEAGLTGVFRLKDLSEDEQLLCGWLSTELTGARLRKVLWAAAAAGGTMHPELRFRLARELQDTDRTFSIEDLQLGIEVLSSQAARGGFNDTDALFLGLIAERAQKTDPEETDTGLEVLKTLTEVIAVPDMRTVEDTGSVKGVTRSDGYPIEDTWRKIGDRLVEKTPERVWEIAAEGLRRQQRITDIGGERRHSFNSWSYGLPAIEERHKTPDWRRGGIYVLVDAGCRALQKMGNRPGDEGQWASFVERCIREDSPLLRRIAVDSVRTTTHWNAEKKIEWASDQARMNDQWTRHERYLLVKETWAEVSKETRNTVAKAIVEMVPMARPDDTPDEEITAYVRKDMIRWLQKQKIVHPEMEAEWTRLKRNDPEAGDGIGMEEGATLGVTAQWLGPNRPKEADELIEEWRRTGNKALEEAVDWKPSPTASRNWPNGPNVEGLAKAVEEAVTACLDYGISFSRILSARKQWNHWGWESLTEAMPKHLDTPAGRQWLEEMEWGAVTHGNTRADWGGMLYSASKLAWDEEWSNQTVEAVYSAANQMLEANSGRETMRRGGIDELPRVMVEASNELEGKAIKTALNLWHLQVKREKAGVAGAHLKASEMIRELGRLATSGEIRIQKYATVFLARGYGLIRQEAPDIAQEVIHERLASKAPMWRDIVWEGLAYCNHWNHSQVGESLKEAMHNDLMEQEDPPETVPHGGEKDQVADKYGYTLVMKMWHEDGSYGEEWQIGEIPKKRRQAVVRKICNTFDRTEAMHSNGWKKVIGPVWKDIAGESGGETTEEEQKAWMACFRHLEEDEQAEFATRFKAGPAADPERLMGYRDEAASIGNREAALEILLHCCEGKRVYNPEGKEFWKWQKILNVVQNEWRNEATGVREGQLIDQLLATHGRKP